MHPDYVPYVAFNAQALLYTFIADMVAKPTLKIRPAIAAPA